MDRRNLCLLFSSRITNRKRKTMLKGFRGERAGKLLQGERRCRSTRSTNQSSPSLYSQQTPKAQRGEGTPLPRAPSQRIARNPLNWDSSGRQPPAGQLGLSPTCLPLTLRATERDKVASQGTTRAPCPRAEQVGNARAAHAPVTPLRPPALPGAKPRQDLISTKGLH